MIWLFKNIYFLIASGSKLNYVGLIMQSGINQQTTLWQIWTRNSLIIIIGTLIVAWLTNVFESGGTAHVLGLMLFWLFLLDIKLSFRTGFRQTLLLLLVYAAIITAVIYVFYPYSEFTGLRSYIYSEWYSRLFFAAAYAPVLLGHGLRFAGARIPEQWTTLTLHYPFALGFYLFYLLLSITRYCTSVPIFLLLLIYNFGLSVIVFCLVDYQVGLLLSSFSFVIWVYLYYPRWGIPFAISSRYRQQQLRRVGQDINKSQQKLEKYLQEIEGL